MERLLKKITDRTAHVAIIGLGYVGLPLAMGFAKAGYHVTGIDVDAGRVGRLKKGDSYIQDVPSSDLRPLVEAGRFNATTEFAPLAEADACCICVPTPLNKTKDPDVSFILQAARAVKTGLRAGQLIVLESTTYPGTTRELLLPMLEESGLKVGVDFCLAFSPERIDPVRESPALDIIKLLCDKGARVSWHDPHVTALKGFEQLTRVPAVNAETLASADCVLIATDHTTYDWDAVVKHARLVVDSRNATRQVTADRHKIVRL